MTSNIDAYNANSSLSYLYSSYEPFDEGCFLPDYALNKYEDDIFFESDASNAYWQILFSQPGTAELD